MTVRDLIDILKQCPQTYKVKAHEIGSPYDFPITKIVKHPRDRVIVFTGEN
jgi:hypothetical protein